MTLSWHDTDQVWLLLHLTYFYMTYCPLLKVCFLGISLSSFQTLIWNVINTNLSWRCLDVLPSQVRLLSRLTYFQLSYCPLQKIEFSGLFSLVFCDIDLKFGLLICLDVIQIKFEFGHVWSNCTPIISFSYNLVFRTFLYNNEIEFRLQSSILAGVMPLWNLLGPVGGHALLQLY